MKNAAKAEDVKNDNVDDAVKNVVGNESLKTDLSSV